MEIVSDIIQADTDTAARAAIRKSGLRPIEIRPVRSSRAGTYVQARRVQRHLRTRRVHTKADFYDALATLLDAGIPIAQALRTMGSARAGQRRLAHLTHALSDSIQSGQALGDAMAEHAAWFDEAEIAMVNAGQQSGEMSSVLRRLADRQSRSGELSSKITTAFSYPILVTVIGIGVTVFLSIKTLPELVEILSGADLETPALTQVVMSLGQGVWNYGLWILLGIGAGILGSVFLLARVARRRDGKLESLTAHLCPRVLFRARTADALLTIAELLGTGVTLVQSLRIVAPTLRGYLGSMLGRSLLDSAAGIEQGEPIASVFDDPMWFTEEHRQLMAAGEAAGELAGTMERIGQRDLRSARRLVDRFTALIEPVAIVLLAVLVGTVVMAAVLPLVRLQEIVG
jgi:general secretion pathway protein F